MEELAKHFADLAEKFRPAVADAAKGAVVAAVYSNLVGSLVALALAGVFYRIGRCLCNTEDPDGMGAGILFGGLALLISLISACVFVWCWIDPWTWIALQHPEIWIAKKAFGL